MGIFKKTKYKQNIQRFNIINWLLKIPPCNLEVIPEPREKTLVKKKE